ncbi:hypothetical protein [Asticcacaulis sp. AND118]|uniref:O-linked N-acetylglucosamine transferase, SPINDLY family protein n=1 Tax=Asticcacaulis sp. AND118 TaxID=2840468 RepID=UPI001CFF9ECC|nr:hypothetical protein [Asticcacaulis sp. AND118]UDF03340.1 hypothetical protein LH365_13005 [Asticcacaulis sp. AND118]
MSAVDPAVLERVTHLFNQGKDALQDGIGATALRAFRTLADENPHSFEVWYWVYSAALCAGDDEMARKAIDTAVLLHGIELMPGIEVDVARFDRDAAYDQQLFETCYASHYVGLASVFGKRARDLGIRTPDMLVRYALSLQHQGRAVEANEAFAAAYNAHPAANVAQFYLYSLFHVPNGVQRYASEARAWARNFADFEAAERIAPRSLDGRRLKVAYVAPNFSKTQLYQFILPILKNHDPDFIEITLYTADTNTETPLPCNRMVSIGHLNDTDAAELIRKDAQDILIDTWGHTAGSRLGIFARRAAPVQVAWINFVQTTGLSQMDYVLHSDSMDAPGTAELFTETVWSMGDITIPYRPTMQRLPDVPPPALTNGFVTFGCFNHPAKISNESVAAWARILISKPDAVLLMKYNYFLDPIVQRTFRARFAAYGVDDGRILFEGHSKGIEYAESYQRIDLMLDPSPCPGGTTSCDAVANGVPVLTLAGDDFYSRVGIQVVAVSGLPELVARSWDDYVARAVALAHNIEALTEIRARTRPGFEASALRDEAGFTRRLEEVFRKMHERAQWAFADRALGSLAS